MTTEQQLKDQCTPDDIKRMVELAEGFQCEENICGASYISVTCDFIDDWIIDEDIFNSVIFPLLIHRAVEGWNKQNSSEHKKAIIIDECSVDVFDKGEYKFKYYQPQSLTQAECAMLHCMLDIFKEERK